MSWTLRKYVPTRLDELIAFAAMHPGRPVWSEDFIRRFVTRLTSSPEMVFDVWRGEKRIAVAVLLDKILNKGNFAHLEILGRQTCVEMASLVEFLLDAAAARLPRVRSGIEFTLHDSYGLLDFAGRPGITPYYETYEMQNSALTTTPLDEEFDLAKPVHDHDLYQLLVESFRDNIDTSIPSYEDWREGRRLAPPSRTFLARANDRFLGFLILKLPEGGVAEIRTVGVLPEARGRGLGRQLILRALNETLFHGGRSCALTVSLQNERALALYTSLGFAPLDRFQVYVWRRP